MSKANLAGFCNTSENRCFNLTVLVFRVKMYWWKLLCHICYHPLLVTYSTVNLLFPSLKTKINRPIGLLILTYLRKRDKNENVSENRKISTSVFFKTLFKGKIVAVRRVREGLIRF